MGTALLVVDEGGVIAFANESAAVLLELSTEALMGGSLSTVFAPLSSLTEALSTSGERRGEVQRNDQLLGYRLTQIEADDARRFAITFQDITELRSLRAERDRLLRLATLGDALPTILHELRNPIASITTSVEVALEESLGLPTQKLLHAILCESRRISVSLEGLGVVARQLRAPRPQPVDYAIREACRLMESRARESGVMLADRVPHLPLLPFDGAAMRAVIFNLVANAIHACVAGDVITVVLELRRAPETLVVSVRDTGSGMDAATLEECRTLFFTTRRSGSGIGLALCNQLAEEAGGQLTVQSRAGQGTTVKLELPVLAGHGDE